MYAKTITAFSFLVAHAVAYSDMHIHQEFNNFINTYGRFYEGELEYHKRFDIFADNFRYVDTMNSRNMSFRLAMNEYADMHPIEFSSLMNGYNSNLKKTSSMISLNQRFRDSFPIHDWRDQGGVMRSKPGQCGSCWSFSSWGYGRFLVYKTELW